MIELTKKHILLVSFDVHAYGSGLKKVVFLGLGITIQRQPGACIGYCATGVLNTSEKVGARIGR